MTKETNDDYRGSSYSEIWNKWSSKYAGTLSQHELRVIHRRWKVIATGPTRRGTRVR